MGIETKVVMPQFATAKILSNLFGVRVVDVLKVLIKLDLEPESPDDPIDQNVILKQIKSKYSEFKIKLKFTFMVS